MQLTATRYEILRQIPSKGAVSHDVAEKPIRVATIISEQRFLLARKIVHLDTVFLEDQFHDWTWQKGKFRYFSRVAEVADVLLVYEETKEG